MSRVEWTPLARTDLAEIDSYWWLNNPARADQIAGRIRSAASFLLEFPEAGRTVGRSGVRKWSVRGTRYLLIYRASSTGVLVIRVRHGATDWLAEL